MTKLNRIVLAVLVSMTVTATVFAQGGPPQGRGFRGGRGPGSLGRSGQTPQDNHAVEHAQDDRHQSDHEVFQFLLSNHDKITRNLVELPNGVETLTESTTPEISEKIKEHVEWMKHRIENTQPIRMRDPLFAELFRHTDKIKMVHQDTANGVRVIETSDDPYVAKLIKEHAKAVSGFVERGFAEAMKNHPVPDQSKTPAAEPFHPTIKGHGSVVQLPTAVHQPRSGTKLLVDITAAGDPSALNPAIEKVAKYVNLYAGGGAKPADVKIAVVFHGDATLSVLNRDAYAAHFQTSGNPNLDLLHQLHEAGVELSVCGQSLISKGSHAADVVVFVDTAVSALTAVVNLQSDGYAYLPLAK